MRIDRFILRLNDKELLAGLKRTTSNERKIQCQFLIYLAEVEKRRLYAIEGYPSLFKFSPKLWGIRKVPPQKEFGWRDEPGSFLRSTTL